MLNNSSLLVQARECGMCMIAELHERGTAEQATSQSYRHKSLWAREELPHTRPCHTQQYLSFLCGQARLAVDVLMLPSCVTFACVYNYISPALLLKCLCPACAHLTNARSGYTCVPCILYLKVCRKK